MLDYERLPLSGAVLIRPKRFTDARGFFSETFREDFWSNVIGPVRFVQENHSRSIGKGVLRGLHFQRPPFGQAKLVRVIQGSVIDVVVDIREGSPTYLKHVAVELNEENGHQLWIPCGFLHGFCTLTSVVDLSYKVDNYYDNTADGAVSFEDPDLGIDWPFPRSDLKLSQKDASAPFLRDIAPPFPIGWANKHPQAEA